MLYRCRNANHVAFHRYGGRGIRVCDEWQAFEPFRDWAMWNGYAEDLTIDRIDPNGHYEPGNCRWATHKEQQRNMRSNRLLTHNGKSQCLAAWAEETGLRENTIRERLKAGWSVERSLTTPVSRQFRKMALSKR